MEQTPLKPTFIKAWRKHRSLNQEWLADAIGITTASLSRIENGKQPYNQRQLEQIAKALKCDPADLLSQDPASPVAEIIEVWRSIPAEFRPIALQSLRAFLPEAGDEPSAAIVDEPPAYEEFHIRARERRKPAAPSSATSKKRA